MESQEQYLERITIKNLTKKQFNKLSDTVIIAVSQFTGDLFIFDDLIETEKEIDFHDTVKFCYFEKEHNNFSDIQSEQKRVRKHNYSPGPKIHNENINNNT